MVTEGVCVWRCRFSRRIGIVDVPQHHSKPFITFHNSHKILNILFSPTMRGYCVSYESLKLGDHILIGRCNFVLPWRMLIPCWRVGGILCHIKVSRGLISCWRVGGRPFWKMLKGLIPCWRVGGALSWKCCVVWFLIGGYTVCKDVTRFDSLLKGWRYTVLKSLWDLFPCWRCIVSKMLRGLIS